MKKLKLGEDELGETLEESLRRYIYYIEEQDLGLYIPEKERYFLGNYSDKVPELLKSVSTKFLLMIISLFIAFFNIWNSVVVCVSSTPLCIQVMLPCKELLVACEWQGEIKDCEELFTPTKSDSGYCCSFNFVDTDQQLMYGL